MLLVAITKTWGPKQPILDPQTHKIVNWKYGKWLPGVPAKPAQNGMPAEPEIPAVPMEWPLDLGLAPPTLKATNPEDQRILDDARAALALDARAADLAAERARMKEELRAEFLAEERAKLKAEVAKEMAAASPAPAAKPKAVPAGA